MSDLTDGIIHVEYNRVTDASDNLIAQTVALETTLDNLEAEIAALITEWSGTDQAVYLGRQANWDAAVKAMGKILTTNAVLLEKLGENYKYYERMAAQALER
ncbi:WXG100 family type VII secretion target [Streptomyces sp. YS415]|uniref:WXG100 family type VII secretion target n=1 Tax=Streptomyces sp. YS415 TaxID=2944806 RepID=UPI00202106F2|nr:WXG100 family type VII secretion target [Streptomyces sp. YS415]MCL7429413.1 WXG100 family type VII secretion target [Streptomyces sp. YS415]